MVNHEFNACSLDLYRHGHDWNSWHSDNLPAYGSNPPVAIVTLGIYTFKYVLSVYSI